MKEIMLNGHHANTMVKFYGDDVYFALTKWPSGDYHLFQRDMGLTYRATKVLDRKRLSTINRYLEPYGIKFVEEV